MIAMPEIGHRLRPRRRRHLPAVAHAGRARHAPRPDRPARDRRRRRDRMRVRRLLSCRRRRSPALRDGSDKDRSGATAADVEQAHQRALRPARPRRLVAAKEPGSTRCSASTPSRTSSRGCERDGSEFGAGDAEQTLREVADAAGGDAALLRLARTASSLEECLERRVSRCAAGLPQRTTSSRASARGRDRQGPQSDVVAATHRGGDASDGRRRIFAEIGADELEVATDQRKRLAEEIDMSHDRIHRSRPHGRPDGGQPGQGRPPGGRLRPGRRPRATRPRPTASPSPSQRVGPRRRAPMSSSRCCRPASTCSASGARLFRRHGQGHAVHRLLHHRRRERASGACAGGRSTACSRSTRRSPAASGGASGATLTFMVGGEESAFAAAKPLLEVMGKKIVHCGDAGVGQAAKICNNMILGISMIAVSEAFVARREARALRTRRCSTSRRPRRASAGR